MYCLFLSQLKKLKTLNQEHLFIKDKYYFPNPVHLRGVPLYCVRSVRIFCKFSGSYYSKLLLCMERMFICFISPFLQDGNGLLQSVKSTDMDDSDLTCFEHSMSLQYPSGSNQAVVSHESELIPHDPIIPDDFLAPEVPDGDNDHDCSTPGSSSNNHLGLASRMQYQRQIVESYVIVRMHQQGFYAI